MKKAIIYSCLIATLSSCESKSSKTTTSVAATSSTACDTSVVKNFLRWYKRHINSSLAVTLVNHPEHDSFYRVNFKNADTYMSVLRSSGFFSDNFLDNKRRYFVNCDEHFKQTRQNDDPAEGFESDLFLFTQEYQELLDSMHLVKFQEIADGPKTKVKLRSIYTNLTFYLTRQNNNCVIDSISADE